MMTPKMKEDLCTQILNASRQLFLSSKISEACQEKGTQKQLEFVLELMNKELTLRDENRRKRLIKRAGFPTYKTFEGYSYQHVKLPPAFSREELESLEFAWVFDKRHSEEVESMPNIKSAKKRVLLSREANVKNKMAKSALKTTLKKFDSAVVAGNREEATAAYKAAVVAVDKAAVKGILHINAGGP